MRTLKKPILLALALALTAPALYAQSYSISWFKVAGGGGASTGGLYTVNGTIGQPDASGPLTGGGYSVTGGFWSLVSVVQSAGTPNLTITTAGTAVIISWAATGTYTLQQNTSLTNPAGWVKSTNSVTTSGGLNSISFTPSPMGNLFFRLANP
jgi:hypothetical protein